MTLRGRDVLLVQRGQEPWKGAWALPGGFVDVGERPEEACLRELREETGVAGEVVALLGVYGDPGRDPRGHVVAIVYVCRAANDAVPHAGAAVPPGTARLPGAGDGGLRAGDDAADARWWPLDAPPPLAADHAQILSDARAWLERAREER